MDGDIELEITHGSGDYLVRVITSPSGGESSGRFELDVDGVLGRLTELEDRILASAVSARRTIPAAEKPLHEVGEQLFRAIFAGSVGGTYRSSLGAAQHSGRPLRVVLRLAAPELAALPWELLFDPDTGSYLCQDMPLLRRIPAVDYSVRPLDVMVPLRILGVVSAPYDLAGLDADAERQRLTDAVSGPVAAGLIDLVWAPDATWQAIQNTLMEGPWHILHFIGHGDYDVRTQEGRIALESVHGRTNMVPASRLMQLLREAQPTPRLVVLNSCASGAAGREDLFSGTAAALVRGGINAVAAMQFTVTDDAAIAFSHGFYSAIAHGRDVDTAAGSGRRAILGLGSLEWVTPVLYVRGGSTQLFNIGGKPRKVQSPTEQFLQNDRTQLIELYDRAISKLYLKQYGTAVSLFDQLLTLDAEYQDAAGLRETARRKAYLEETYRKARSEEEARHWAAAASSYAQLRNEPDFPDAGARLEACELKQKVASLEAEIRRYAAAEDWRAVLASDSALSAIDSAAADPDGLATLARIALFGYQSGKTYDAPDQAPPSTGQAPTRDVQAGVRDITDVFETASGRAVGNTPAQAAVTPHSAEQAVQSRSPGSELLVVRHKGEVRAVAFSPDGGRLATGGWDNMARVWDCNNGNAIMTKETKGFLRGMIMALAFSPDGSRVAAGVMGSTAYVWDASRGNELIKVQHAAVISSVTAVAFSPDGARLATSCEDKTVRIWNASTGAYLFEISHTKAVRAVAFSLDGYRLATGSDDRVARIWNSTTGAQLLEVRHALAGVTAVAFSPDGSILATGSDDKSARVWAADSGNRLLEVRHGKPVKAVAFSPDGTRLATGGDDNVARIWNATTGAQLLEVRHDKAVRAVAFSPDGRRLATGGADYAARIWMI